MFNPNINSIIFIFIFMVGSTLLCFNSYDILSEREYSINYYIWYYIMLAIVIGSFVCECCQAYNFEQIFDQGHNPLEYIFIRSFMSIILVGFFKCCTHELNVPKPKIFIVISNICKLSVDLFLFLNTLLDIFLNNTNFTRGIIKYMLFKVDTDNFKLDINSFLNDVNYLFYMVLIIIVVVTIDNLIINLIWTDIKNNK